MKKILQLIKKRKKKTEISDDIDSDAVPEAPRDIPHYTPNQSAIYNNFVIDACCMESNLNDSSSQSDSVTSEGEETLNLHNGESQTEDIHLAATEAEQEVREETSNCKNQADESVKFNGVGTPGEDVIDKNLHVQLHAVQTTNPDLIFANNNEESENNVVPVEDLTVQGLNPMQNANCHVTKGSNNRERKNSGNTYVITISNSKHFHIGSQKVVNYPNIQSELRPDNSRSTIEKITNGNILSIEGNEIYDAKDKLTEEDILQISLSVQDKWRDLARNLGISDSVLRELEELNDRDQNLIVYDFLKRYHDRYPNTSVGFMASVLKKSQETEAMRKLLESR